MSMVLAAAAIALAALHTYNRSRSTSPAMTDERVNDLRQATAVVLAVAEAVWAILDALVGNRSSGKRKVSTPTPSYASTDDDDGPGRVRKTWGLKLASDLA